MLCVTAEQRSRLGAEGAVAADTRQRAQDEQAERRIQQIMRDYQHEINNYELLQKGTYLLYLYLTCFT